MRVEYQFIMALNQHSALKYIAKPILVKKEIDKGFFTLVDWITPENIASLPYRFDALEIQLIKIAEEYNNKQIQKLFSKKKTLKTFFNTLTEQVLEKQIRPYIDKRLQKIFEILINKDIDVYLQKKHGSIFYESDKIHVQKKKAETIFNFVQSETELLYFLSLFHAGKNISLTNKNAIIISNEPCSLILNHNLYLFNDIDGKKLSPFLHKAFISIPKSAEKKYYKTFVFNAVKNYRVKAKGFTVNSSSPKPIPKLFLEKDWKNNPVLILKFAYPDIEISANNKDAVLVQMKKNNEQKTYVFEKIIRNKKAENTFVEILTSAGLMQETDAVFKIKTHENTPFEIAKFSLIEWLNKNTARLSEHGFVINQDYFEKTYLTENIKLDIKIEKKKDWFDIYGNVILGDYSVPFIDLKKNILNKIREFELPDNKIVVLPEEWFADFRELMLFAERKDNKLSLKNYHFNVLTSNVFDKDVLIEKFKTLNHKNARQTAVPSAVKASLRDYQKEGFNWLLSLQENKFGGCLADDMGLGKTLQTLALLAKTPEKSQADVKTSNTKPQKVFQLSLFDAPSENSTRQTRNVASLIIMPTSLIHNWENEIRKFTPDFRVQKYVGTRTKELSQFENADIVLTSYGIVRNDAELLKNFTFHYIILDESQNIKNPESKIYRAVNMLRSQYKLVLTGTPIENSLQDLWAQLNFINPGVLGNLPFFREKFIEPIEKNKDKQQVAKLQKIIQPFILRRTKAQVAKDLPPLSVQVRYCEMENEHRKYYETEKSKIRNGILQLFDKKRVKHKTLLLIQGLTKLRQIANHPLLTDDSYTGTSEKFNQVIDDIHKLIAENHKVLIFSSFVKHLNLFAEYCKDKELKFSILTGASTKRESVINEFQNTADKHLFFISLKAGGVGLNLTSADYVFILDPWWNPAAELQAINRAHRIGQEKKVFVYKYISCNSIEEKIYKLQEKKSALADTFVNSNNPFKDIDVDALKDLFT